MGQPKEFIKEDKKAIIIINYCYWLLNGYYYFIGFKIVKSRVNFEDLVDSYSKNSKTIIIATVELN